MLRALPYNLVDIGANLGHPAFKDDLTDVLERAKLAGLKKIMITGTSIEVTQQARELCRQQQGFLYFTAGVHPHDAKEFKENDLGLIREMATDSQCVAIGECGLDFNRNFSPPDVQKDVFEKQVSLACDLRKPLFIHEREAQTDMIEILTKFKGRLPPAVIHCFTGTAMEAARYIEEGFYIGLTGFLWKDRAEDGVKYVLKNHVIPLERLMIETDAPFMYPKINDKKIPPEVREKITEGAKSLHKFSSFKRNEPSSLASVCELIAAYMDEDPVKVAEATTANAELVYGLQ
ncbi:hypothetical protein AB6A40_005720 [Gnathostoma spinigerum]|uniref:Deoxyribonuclease TATDN1 n=1 Tax=Gnathostoma spinigerum TaxID=75299 RepID=A0ABD6EH17_9BILA